jgi:hypothetical protein
MDYHKLDRRVLLAGSAALLATGCFGSFKLTDLVYSWNGSVSDNKWVRWLVFLVMVIVPVYGIVLLVDAVVLNSIEFWTGDNPVHGSDDGHGNRVVASRTEDPTLTKQEHYKDSKLVRTLYCQRIGETEMRLLDDQRRVLLAARRDADGVQLLDREGAVLVTLSDADCNDLARRISDGESIHAAGARSLARADHAMKLSRVHSDFASSTIL